jgi:hypothetical protein
MSKGILFYADIEKNRSPIFYGPMFGSDAYCGWQTLGYLQQLQNIKKVDTPICWTPNFELFLPALQVIQEGYGAVSFEEMGSTLFASIDKLEKAKTRYNFAINLHDIDFIGIEVMDQMVFLAEQLHQKYKISHHKNVLELSSSGTNRVKRSYQATSYAFNTTEDFAKWTIDSKFSLQGAYCSLSDKTETVTVMGNSMRLFSISDFYKMVQDSGHTIILLDVETRSYSKIFDCYQIFFVTHCFESNELDRFMALTSNMMDPESLDFSQSTPLENFFKPVRTGVMLDMLEGGLRQPVIKRLLRETNEFDFRCEVLESFLNA